MLAVLAAALMSAPPARAANASETFVQQNINIGLQILSDSKLSQAQRRDKFHDFILALTDMRRIALFTLGPFRRGASDADLNAFVAAFTDYANAVYESYLSKYKSQTMTVTGSVEKSPTDFVVNAEVLDPGKNQNIDVAFRVLSDTGHPLVVDVQVLGIWLAQDQRDQFTAFLQQNNGNIGTLIEHLKAQTAQVRAGSAPPTANPPPAPHS